MTSISASSSGFPQWCQAILAQHPANAVEIPYTRNFLANPQRPTATTTVRRLREGILSVVQIEPNVWDPSRTNVLDEIQLHSLMFEGLFQPNNQGGIYAGLATHYDVSADGLHYIFHLRPDARWSDGSRITAQDVAYSWQRQLSPKFASPSVEMFINWVRGAAEFNEGSVNFSRVGIRALNDTQLAVDLKLPFPSFPVAIANSAAAPVPRSAIEKLGARAFEAGSMVGNGPYLLKEYRSGSDAILRQNPHYWNAAAITFKSIHVYFTNSDSTASDWFEVGKVDWVAMTLSPEVTDHARSANLDRLYEFPSPCIFYLFLNNQRPPFSDAAVRKSLSYFVDSERLALHALKGTRSQARSFLPDALELPSMGTNELLDSVDPSAGAHFLANIGHPRGIGIPPFEILYANYTRVENVMVVVYDQLKRGGHYAMELINMEFAVARSNASRGEYDMYYGGKCADTPDPAGLLLMFKSDSQDNVSRYRSAEYDRVMEQLQQTADPAIRLKYAHEALVILKRDMPAIPLFSNKRFFLMHPAISGAGPALYQLASQLGVRP